MKVDGTSISPVGSIQATNKIEQVRKKMLSSGNDQVTVSDKAQIYQDLMSKIKEMPSVREEKVKNLSEQLANGLYQPDIQKIAEKLFDGLINKKG
jgi:negative regulator of flagellin synthesis FlgM